LTENDFNWCDYGLLADFFSAAGQRARDIRRVTFLPQSVRTRGQPSLFPQRDEHTVRYTELSPDRFKDF
jgi:hypothetical protein